MAVNVNATLHAALGQLESERDRVARQIQAVRSALGGTPGEPAAVRSPARRRRRMSAAARKAVSRRMKAYWAKRRAGKAKGAGTKKAK